MDTQIYILIDSVFWQIHVNKQLKIHHQHSQFALSEHQLVRIGIFFIKEARFAQSYCHGLYSIQLSKYMAVVTSQWRSWNRGIRAGTANRIILLPIVQGDMKTVSASERRHCICNMFSKIVIDFLWPEMIEDGSLISHRECYDHVETKLVLQNISTWNVMYVEVRTVCRDWFSPHAANIRWLTGAVFLIDVAEEVFFAQKGAS